MSRTPTPKELDLINASAEKPMTAEECHLIDAQPANDMFKTCYGYMIGTSSLHNFKADLENKRVFMNVMHQRSIPLGNWLPGSIERVNPAPEGAKEGRNSVLCTTLFMPKTLTIDGHSTDDLAKAHDTGVLTDCSILWNGGKMECNVCGQDYRLCDHLAGEEYDGVECVPSLEDSHIDSISLVDKGGLPGATLSAGNENLIKEGIMDWKALKKMPLDQVMSGSLSTPLKSIPNILFSHNSTVEPGEPSWGTVDKTKLPDAAFADRSGRRFPHHWVKGGEVGDDGKYKNGTMYLHKGGLHAAWAAANGARSGQEASPAIKAHLQAHRRAIGEGDENAAEITFEQVQEKFVSELTANYVPKHLHDALKTKLAAAEETIEVATAQHESTVTILTAKETELTTLTQKVADMQELFDVGQQHMEFLTSEYHRYGIVLQANKWPKDLEDTHLNAMSISDRKAFLVFKITQMREEAVKIYGKTEVPGVPGAVAAGKNPHLMDDKYYVTGGKKAR